MLDYKTVNIQDLTLNAGNPRVNDHAVDKLIKGIEAYGFVSPVVANRENNLVLAGHTRIKALLKMGHTDVPVLFVDMDDTTAKAYSIWDNKSAELADWDMELLNDEMDLLIADGFDIDLTGFDDFDFGNSEEDPPDTEVNMDDIEEKMSIKLEYSFDEYQEIRELISGLSESPESVFKKALLGS